MKIAVISDVHSNVYALRAALGELKRIGYDKLVFAGDIVGTGAYPEETVSLCRAQKGAIFVKGNHDMFAASDFNPYREGSDKYLFFEWQQKVMSRASKDFLASMNYVERFTVFGKEVVVVHYPMRGDRFVIPKYLPTERELAALFSGLRGDVFLFGHEHTGSLCSTGGRFYLNFGTCGNYLEKDVARCGVAEITESGVRYEVVRARYDDDRPAEMQSRIAALLAAR